MRKLHRHHQGYGKPVVSGIFAGLGEWMEVNPQLLRAGYIVLGLILGIIPAIVVYFFFHRIIPKK